MPGASVARTPAARRDALRTRIMDLAQGHMVSQALFTANRIGLLALLAAGPQRERDLPRRLGCSARGLRALVDALAGFDLLRRRGDAVQASREMSVLFHPDSAMCLGAVLEHQRRLSRRWQRLDLAVRAGRPVSEPARGAARRKHFLLAMVGGSQKSIGETFARVDLSRRRRLLDLGGGLGAYAAAAAQRWPHLECTLFDLPGSVAPARRFLRQRGLAERVRCRGGDARRDPLGGPYDAILISNVLHMFSPRDGLAILRRARRALAPGGLVLFKDFVLRDDRSGPPRAGLFALNMLLATEGGGVLTGAEWLDLFARAGLRRVFQHPIGEGSRLYGLRVAPPAGRSPASRGRRR